MCITEDCLKVFYYLTWCDKGLKLSFLFCLMCSLSSVLKCTQRSPQISRRDTKLPPPWPFLPFLPYRQIDSMTPTRPTAPQSRPRTPTWWSRCSAHTTSLPPSSLTWRAALSTRTCGWPASPTASAPSPPGPSKSTNATQETRTSSAPWTCRWEATSLWLQPCQSCRFSLFFEALLCVGLASKARLMGMTASIFVQSVPLCRMPAVWLKVFGAVGDLVCCEILMILIKITHCWQWLNAITAAPWLHFSVNIKCCSSPNLDVFLSKTACSAQVRDVC